MEYLKIETPEGRALQADRFISYGTDPEYFAVVGKDLYVKRGEYYRILQENFQSEE